MGAELIERHCKKIGVERLNSRAASAPKLARIEGVGQWLKEDEKEEKEDVKHIRSQIREKVMQWRGSTKGVVRFKPRESH